MYDSPIFSWFYFYCARLLLIESKLCLVYCLACVYRWSTACLPSAFSICLYTWFKQLPRPRLVWRPGNRSILPVCFLFIASLGKANVVSRETKLLSLLKPLQQPAPESRNALTELSVLRKLSPIGSRLAVFLLKGWSKFYPNQKWTK